MRGVGWRRRRGSAFQGDDGDPLSVIVNLFDVSMVFAVGLMVAMVVSMHMSEVFTGEDFTVVKNPGREDMEIITREGKKITRYRAQDSARSESKSQRRGRGVGVAYELENGEIIYLPE